ncbi:acyltransferase family protein [Kineococcus sp. TBRC 1896]|uniref:Acyltransferase family protein n=1 Tax=Kineococcus mangrovi TaxID=1660183 RepID=A0ABV4HXU7_9ACTN
MNEPGQDVRGTTVTVAAPATTAVRMTWMDVLRGLAILAVVLFHAGTLLRFAQLEVPEGLRAFNRAVAPFRIPMLVLLSGMLLPRSIAKGPGPYVVGKARAILWPFLLWSSVMVAVKWLEYGHPSLKWLLPNIFLAGGTYLWYLLFLLVFYVVALPLRRVPLLPVAVVFLALAEVAVDDSKWGERAAFLFALFLIGWWVADHPAVVERGLSSSRWPFAALGVGVLSYALGDMSGYGPRAIAGTLSGVYLLAWGASRVSRTAALRPLRFVGRNSVVFYCVHFPLVVVLMTAAGWLRISSSALLMAVAFVASVVAGAVLSLLRPRSSFVAGLFVAPAWVARAVTRIVPGRWTVRQL